MKLAMLITPFWQYLMILPLAVFLHLFLGSGTTTVDLLVMTALIVLSICNGVSKQQRTALNLSISQARKLGLWRSGLLTAVVIAVALFARTWWLAGIFALAFTIKAGLAVSPVGKIQPLPVKKRSTAATQEGSTTFGGFPVTPAAQLVIRPLLTGWALVLLCYVTVILVLRLMNELWQHSDHLNTLPLALLMYPATLYLMNSYRDSLQRFITLGGTRQKWARLAVFSLLAAPIAGIAIYGWQWLWWGHAQPALVAIFLLAGGFMPMVELSTTKLRHLRWLLRILAILVFTALIAGDVPAGVLLGVSLLVYVLGLIFLPMAARRVAVFTANAA